MTILKILILTACLGEFFCESGASNRSHGSPDIGVFDGHHDIGENVKPGSAFYNPETREYKVSGAGNNIGADHDESHFLWKKMIGDFLVYTRAEFVGEGTHMHRKVGWMARASLEGNAAHVSAVVHGDGLASLQYRKNVGAEANEIKASITHADVIQLERKGDTYTVRIAKFGEPFVIEQVTDIVLGEEVYVGLFVNSHAEDVVEQGVFRDVRITVPAPDTLTPYRQYLGSNIELLDVESGKREVVYYDSTSLQAPNWTVDGKSLIYNSGGLMYRLDLGTKQPQVINTGSVTNNNNDHVISFDGKMLGLSSGVQELGGSIIWTVPIEGGEPKQITPRGPSYLHGWSPDGKTLVFTGQRNDEFDIYSIPAEGGPEKRLTTAPGLDDGPEYAPDGRYIYFNSNRTGTMQIWRMDVDGTNQVPITHGDFHDWFPHVSPDGSTLLFISYLKEEVESGDHPFYKHVYLRAMPTAGGVPRVVAYLYGGQGTINTPSWSPDSKRVAFVSNSGDIQSVNLAQ